VYRNVGGHSYGSVYSGPIGAVITPLLRGLPNYGDLPNASSLCGACGEACPVKIDLPGLLISLRRGMVDRKLFSATERLMMRLYAWSLKHSWTYRAGQLAQRIGLRTMADRDGYVRRGMVGPLKKWTDGRDLPAPAKQSFTQWWDHQSP
jgi:L-lactate dehydrogenase complex protein LldF